ncbi:MAG: alpha/beta hydrolase [Dehalococcoidia bacterium]
MANRLDYSILDDPRLLQFVFSPRPDWTHPPAVASDHYVPVEPDISVFCRFYSRGKSAKTILYFHGNGEVVCDYDGIAPFYNEIGLNLFVADYRGYGPSGGRPTFAGVASDAHRIFQYFENMLQSEGYTAPLYVMGRSLGSQSAMELAASYPGRIKGLILESGFLQNSRLLRNLGVSISIPNLEEFEQDSIEFIKGITMPVLIIHGERDILIPHIEAQTIFDHIGSREKKLVTIDGAGHNDILICGIDRYFNEIRDFIFLGG